MNNIQELNIKQLTDLPVEDILNLYKNGFRLSEQYLPVKSLATCPVTVTQGNEYQFKLESTGGVPPYKFEVYIDGIMKNTFNSQTGGIYNHIIAEPVGNHTVEAKMTDSCSTPQIITDTCTINVISVPIPSEIPPGCLAGNVKIPLLNICAKKDYITVASVALLLFVL